jgi:ribosomal protein L11 methyltransferase
MDYIEVDFKITPREPGADILCTVLCDIGFDSFVDTEEGLAAYVPSNDFSEDSLKHLLQDYEENFKVEYKIKEVPAQNWNSEWEKNFSPVEINEQCVIRAPFHEPFKVKYEIIIEPKMSFGTGHHQTTALMANAMLEPGFKGIVGKRVLDMGCGTGVLAILAAKIGAGEVMAIDNDEWAYSNTLENIGVNDENSIKVALGDAKLLEGREFDSILANINRNILLRDMPAYADALAEGGNLLMSGFFVTDIELLKEKAASLGLEPVDQNTRENWALLWVKK